MTLDVLEMAHMKYRQQRGLTFLGLLVVGGLLAFTGVILAQVVPLSLIHI